MRSLVAWASQVNLSLCCGTVQKDGPPLFSNLMSRLRAELRLSDLQEHDAPLQVCSDGSYEHAPSSINSLGETPRLTLHEGHGAAAIVWMGSSSNWKDIPPRILRIVKPSATDMTTAATMELTGLSTALCISQNQIPSCSPIISDCQGAIAKAKAAGSMSDHMVSPTDGGLLQHMLRTKIPTTNSRSNGKRVTLNAEPPNAQNGRYKSGASSSLTPLQRLTGAPFATSFIARDLCSLRLPWTNS